MEEQELYSFESLKEFLHLNGIQVKEPYMPIDSNDVDWYDGGKHIEFEKDGIYLTKRNGGKQKVFLYRKDFFREKPTFHVFCCSKVRKELIGKVFRCGNTESVPVVEDKRTNKTLGGLPICGYCAEKAGLDKSYNSTSYIKLLRRGQSIVDVHTNENLSVYSENWQDVKEKYMEAKNYRCEKCGVHIADIYDRDAYLVVVHRNRVYNDDAPENLQCLCLDCLAKQDHRSVWVNGANKLILAEFRKRYKGVSHPRK